MTGFFFLITFLLWFSYANICLSKGHMSQICYSKWEPTVYLINRTKWKESKYSVEDKPRKRRVMHWLENKLMYVLSIYNSYFKSFLTKIYTELLACESVWHGHCMFYVPIVQTVLELYLISDTTCISFQFILCTHQAVVLNI